MTVNYVYLGYGTTDENGECKLDHDANGDSISHSYIGTGAGKIDVVASLDSPSSISDSSLVSKIFSISDYYYYDTQTVDKSRYTRTGGTASLTYSNNGLNVTGTQNSISILTNNVLTLPSSYTAEITVTAHGSGSNYGGFVFDDCLIDLGTGIYVYKYSDTSALTNWAYNIQSGDIVKIEMDNGTMKIYINDVLKTTQSITHTGYFRYRTYKNRSLTTKDLKVKPL